MDIIDLRWFETCEGCDGKGYEEDVPCVGCGGWPDVPARLITNLKFVSKPLFDWLTSHTFFVPGPGPTSPAPVDSHKTT